MCPNVNSGVTGWCHQQKRRYLPIKMALLSAQCFQFSSVAFGVPQASEFDVNDELQLKLVDRGQRGQSDVPPTAPPTMALGNALDVMSTDQAHRSDAIVCQILQGSQS